MPGEQRRHTNGFANPAADACESKLEAPIVPLHWESPNSIDRTLMSAVEADLPRILALLLLHTGHSFHSYKSASLARCILARMMRVQAPTIGEYGALLERNEEESHALLSSLLVGLTSFFRDPESWMTLASVLELRLRGLAEGSVFRAWVPGCSTGQDAFSLAMILHEIIARTGRRVSLRLFATDINLEALEVARRGHYPATIAREVSQERLRDFFATEGGGYRVHSWLRDGVFFGEQNVVTDPPISSVQLIVCRNLLIYLDAPERARVSSIFHHALQRGGLLFTGTAETSESSALFSPLHRQHPIYARVDAARSPLPWTRSALREAARRTNGSTAALSAPPASTTPSADPGAGESGIVREVRRRLRSTRTRALPELRVTDDQLRSAIEELVSTNEQLETSREQVYTLNEELMSINSTLESQIEALHTNCDDLSNVLRASDVAAIIVTCKLEIVRFTEGIASFMPLKSTDVGRPLADIRHASRYEGLIDDAREVVRTLQTRESCCRMGRSSVLVRVSPYRTAENVFPGLVITFTDVGKLVGHLQERRSSKSGSARGRRRLRKPQTRRQ